MDESIEVPCPKCGHPKLLTRTFPSDIAQALKHGCRHCSLRTNLRHGHTRWKGSNSSTYATWNAMLRRCTNSKDRRFADYGGRGITVDADWFKFENFLADMGERPAPLLSLDRKDNDGPYTAWNCQWATRAEQAANRRPQKKRRQI